MISPGAAWDMVAAVKGPAPAPTGSYRAYYLVLMADQHQLSPQGLRNYQSWARQVNHSAADLLRQGVEERLVRPDIDIPIAVNLLNSALTSIARWYHPTNRLRPDQIHDQVMKLLHGLLLPQPAIAAPPEAFRASAAARGSQAVILTRIRCGSYSPAGAAAVPVAPERTRRCSRR